MGLRVLHVLFVKLAAFPSVSFGEQAERCKEGFLLRPSARPYLRTSFHDPPPTLLHLKSLTFKWAHAANYLDVQKHEQVSVGA